MIEIACYVQRRYTKQAYHIESYDVRGWPGLEMVRDALLRAGHQVSYCGAETVTSYRIILVSITSASDWYSFLAERARWPRGNYRVVVGGSGVLNIRPVLWAGDAFVFGRGEELILPLVSNLLGGGRYEHESVAYRDTFSPSMSYRIAQAQTVYPHPYRLATGQEWREVAIGCQLRCLFCQYTWHRKHIGGIQRNSGAAQILWPSADERTFFDLDLDHPETWEREKSVRILGLDGMSERLRFMARKPITRQMLLKFLRGMASLPRPHKIKLYNIVGYPTETPDDWEEFRTTLAEADAACPAISQPQWGLDLHSTPFRAMPATPAATWPMAYENYRGKIANCLRRPGMARNAVFYQGRAWWAVETMGTESLPTVALDALILRGTEKDEGLVRRLATTPQFWSARTADKRATLEDACDIKRFFGAHTWNDLPTAYLKSWATEQLMQRAGTKGLASGGRSVPTSPLRGVGA